MSLLQKQFPISARSQQIRISVSNRRALTFLCVTLGIFLFALASPAADEVLNNASVIELQGLGLGDPVIIGKIKTSKCNFDTSVNGLKELKAAKVSSAVIEAMLATKSTTPTAAAAAPAVNGDVNDPLAMHPGGVWALQEVDGKKTMTRIEFFRPIMANKVGGYNPWTGMSHEQFVYLPGQSQNSNCPIGVRCFISTLSPGNNSRARADRMSS